MIVPLRPLHDAPLIRRGLLLRRGDMCLLVQDWLDARVSSQRPLALLDVPLGCRASSGAAFLRAAFSHPRMVARIMPTRPSYRLRVVASGGVAWIA